MNQTKLTNAELNMLKNCIDTKLQSITADSLDRGETFGGVVLTFSDQIIAVDNDYRLVPYYGGEEELPGFNVLKLNKKEDYHFQLSPPNIITKNINLQVITVKVIRDEICVKFADGHSEDYVVDEAIIFDLGDVKLLLGLEMSYSPFTIISLKPNAEDDMVDVETVRYNWSDDDHQTYQATVNRHGLDLSKEEF